MTTPINLTPAQEVVERYRDGKLTSRKIESRKHVHARLDSDGDYEFKFSEEVIELFKTFYAQGITFSVFGALATDCYDYTYASCVRRNDFSSLEEFEGKIIDALCSILPTYFTKN